MINLLPHEAKHEVYTRYRERRSVILLIFLCLLLAASTLVLASMYTLLRTDAETLTGNRDTLKARLESSEYGLISREAKDLRGKVDIILHAEDGRLLTELRAAIDRTLGEGVTLSALQFARANPAAAGQAGKLSLTARVSDRKRLLQWEDRLKSEPMFAGVTIPTASLIKNDENDVTLSFTVVPQEKKP